MHLLNTKTYERVKVEDTFNERPPFAIVSHRWEGVEIRFKDYNAAALLDNSNSFQGTPYQASASKIRGACQIARNQRLDYLSIDTCCIDKDSSEELRKALNSMFAWYAEATICYTFLSDASSTNDKSRMFDSDIPERQQQGKPSVWFERGWTLQELLAPRSMEFYDKTWNFMGTRHDLALPIGTIAGIRPQYLRDEDSRNQTFREASVATKLSWMAGRVTREVEDIAYSLLGILNVNMIPQYGEGIKAFMRLQETLMAASDSFDESLFAWAMPPDGKLKCYRQLKTNPQTEAKVEIVPQLQQTRWGLLAPSPDCFTTTSDVSVPPDRVVPRLGAGFQRTHQGIHLNLPLKETKSRLTGMDRKAITLPLNCWRGNDPVVLELSRDAQRVWMRSDCSQIESKRGAKVGHNRVLGIDQGQAIVGEVTIAQPQLRLTYPDPS